MTTTPQDVPDKFDRNTQPGRSLVNSNLNITKNGNDKWTTVGRKKSKQGQILRGVNGITTPDVKC